MFKKKHRIISQWKESIRFGKGIHKSPPNGAGLRVCQINKSVELIEARAEGPVVCLWCTHLECEI
jgi:hypothetical protein